MRGRATYTTVASSTTMSCAVAITSSAAPPRPPRAPVRPLAGALVADLVWDMMILSGRADVVVAAEDVGRVVASLDGGEALVGGRRVGEGDVGPCRRPEEADVRPGAVGRDGGPRGQRLAGRLPWRTRREHHRRDEQGLGVPVGERGRVRRDAAERAAKTAQLDGGPGAEQLDAAGDRLVAQGPEEGVAHLDAEAGRHDPLVGGADVGDDTAR